MSIRKDPWDKPMSSSKTNVYTRGRINFGGGSSKLISTDAKTLFVIFVYMILLTTTSFIFQMAYVNNSYFDDYDELDMNSIFGGQYEGGANVDTIEFMIMGHSYDIEKYREISIDLLSHDDIFRSDSVFMNFVESHDGFPIPYSTVLRGIVMKFPDGFEMTSTEWDDMVEAAIECGDIDKVGFIAMFESAENSAGGWFEGLTRFFSTITDVFGFMLDFLTFNFYPSIEMPTLIGWLPFLMSLPVWIYIAMLVMPYAIDVVKAIASTVDAIIPF